MKVLHQAPFIRIALFFIAGIVLQYYLDIGRLSPGALVLSLLLILLSYIGRKQYRTRWLFGVGTMLLFLSAGSLLSRERWKASEWDVPQEKHSYCMRVLDEPVAKPRTRMCRMEILSADSIIYQGVRKKKVIVYLPKDSISKEIVAGDCLRATLILKEPEALPGSTFDYPLYLRKQSVAAIGFVRPGEWEFVDQAQTLSERVKFSSLKIRRSFLQGLRVILPEKEHFGVAAALMFGYKHELDSELRQRFSNIGAGHILAISGLHFHIIFGMIFYLFSFLGAGKQGKYLRLLFVLPLIWGFAFLTGFSPSVNRAAWMMSIWIVGHTFFFRSFSINTVASSALLMLLANPLYLFDVSFQLSYSAVTAIVWLNPYLKQLYWSVNPVLSYLWELICISITAQLGVLPLSVYYFHQLPLLFLLTNVLIIPLVTIVLFLIPFTLLLSLISVPFAYPLSQSLDVLIAIITRIDAIPQGTIPGLQIDSFQTLLLYLALIALALALTKKRIVWLYCLLITALIYGVYHF